MTAYEGLNLGRVGELVRIDVRRYMRCAISLLSDDSTTAVARVVRSWGAGTVDVPYSPTKTLSSDGEVLELDVHDCPELVVELTTAGSTGDRGSVFVGFGGETAFSEWWETVDLSEPCVVWSRNLRPFERHVSLVLSPTESNTAAVELVQAPMEGALPDQVATETIAVDETVTAFYVSAARWLGVRVTTGQSGQTAELYGYSCIGIAGAGMIDPNIALLDANQEFSGSVGFSGNLSIGDISTGLHTISTSSTANRAVNIPDVEGEFAIVSDVSPADGEYLVRSGNGYESTSTILAANGSVSAPGIGFASDPDNGLYRTGVNTWAMAAGGSNMMTLQNSGVFTLLSLSAGILNMAATFAWTISCPAVLVINSSASAGAIFQLREGTSNGSNYVQIAAPSALASNVTLTLPSSAGSTGDVMVNSGSGALAFIGPESLDFSSMKTGASQGAAGASAGELWSDTSDGNTVKLGV